MAGLGIDLGTANTVVARPGSGVIYDQPSQLVFRVDKRRQRLLTVGTPARELAGRTPAGLVAVRPLEDGAVTDLRTAATYLRAVVKRLPGPPWVRTRPHAVIGVPAGATVLERRGLLEAAEEARLARVRLLPEPVAGAVGCGVDPLEPRTHLVVDIGGGTAEATAFCFGGIVADRTCKVAGDEMTAALARYLREQHQVVVGDLAAEQVKIAAAGEDPSLLVEGQDAATGRPRLLSLSVEEVADAIRPVTTGIAATLADCLDDLPAQSISDISATGALVFGGGALLRGLDKVLEQALGLGVRRADRPLTCVAEGAARALRASAVLDAYARD